MYNKLLQNSGVATIDMLTNVEVERTQPSQSQGRTGTQGRCFLQASGAGFCEQGCLSLPVFYLHRAAQGSETSYMTA